MLHRVFSLSVKLMISLGSFFKFLKTLLKFLLISEMSLKHDSNFNSTMVSNGSFSRAFVKNPFIQAQMGFGIIFYLTSITLNSLIFYFLNQLKTFHSNLRFLVGILSLRCNILSTSQFVCHVVINLMLNVDKDCGWRVSTQDCFLTDLFSNVANASWLI